MAPLWVLQKVYASGPSVREPTWANANADWQHKTEPWALTLVCGRCPTSLRSVNVYITPNPGSRFPEAIRSPKLSTSNALPFIQGRNQLIC